MNTIDKNVNNKIKIVYKKPTCYDSTENSTESSIENYTQDKSDSSNDSNDSNDLDNSVSSNDSELIEDSLNNNIDKVKNQIEQNEILRNNIHKELSYNNNNDNNNSSDDKNIPLYLVKKFVRYLKKNKIDFEELNNHTFLNNIIKKYIIENNINQNYIVAFLEELKIKINSSDPTNLTNSLKIFPSNLKDSDSNLNTDSDMNSDTNSDLETKIFENFENYQNGIDNEQMTNKKSIIELLSNNDINTWLFIGVILISFIFIIMITIHKK